MSALWNEVSNPDSVLRKDYLGKITNEFTNPESRLRKDMIGGLLMAGISVKNETPFPIQVVCSQITPLHWSERPILPGETFNLSNKECNMGKVWFTVTVGPFVPSEKPNLAGVARSIGKIVVGVLFTVAVVALVAVAIAGAAKDNPQKINDSDPCSLCRKNLFGGSFEKRSAGAGNFGLPLFFHHTGAVRGKRTSYFPSH